MESMVWWNARGGSVNKEVGVHGIVERSGGEV